MRGVSSGIKETFSLEIIVENQQLCYRTAPVSLAVYAASGGDRDEPVSMLPEEFVDEGATRIT
jgi:hypothetical protein